MRSKLATMMLVISCGVLPLHSSVIASEAERELAEQDEQQGDKHSKVGVIASSIAGAALAAGVVTCVIVARTSRGCMELVQITSKRKRAVNVIGEDGMAELEKIGRVVQDHRKNLVSQDSYQQFLTSFNSVFSESSAQGRIVQKALEDSSSLRFTNYSKFVNAFFSMDEEEFVAITKKAAAELDTAALAKAYRDAFTVVEGTGDVFNTVLKHMDTKKLATAIDKLLEQQLNLNFKVGTKLPSPLQFTRRIRSSFELLEDTEFVTNAMKHGDALSSLPSTSSSVAKVDTELMSRKMEELVDEIYKGPNLNQIADDLDFDLEDTKGGVLDLLDSITPASANGAAGRAARTVERITVAIGDKDMEVVQRLLEAADRAAKAARKAADVAHDPAAKEAAIEAAKAVDNIFLATKGSNIEAVEKFAKFSESNKLDETNPAVMLMQGEAKLAEKRMTEVTDVANAAAETAEAAVLKLLSEVP